MIEVLLNGYEACVVYVQKSVYLGELLINTERQELVLGVPFSKKNNCVLLVPQSILFTSLPLQVFGHILIK